MKAWFYFSDHESNLCKTDIVQSLLHEGITDGNLNLDSPYGTGVYFFSEVRPILYERLWKLSSEGRERVLAIAVPGIELPVHVIWQLLKSGAAYVLAWDQTTDPSKVIAAHLKRWEMVDSVLESPLVRNNLIGKSILWRSVLRQIIEVAHFTKANILIQGESGTGKELVARLIHTLDSRPQKGDLIVVDCTTIVTELSGSELFGHERGAFTGATNVRNGAFALANGGTLLLDEVGELPLSIQAQLLRVVQEHSYKPVGGNSWQQTDFRLVCATNRNLLEGVKRGEFRHDLYYRIANWTFTLPPLRDRLEDIFSLASHFVQECLSKETPIEMDNSIKDYLIKREYPGNVRDLKHLISRIMLRHVGCGPVTAGDIPEDERASGEMEKIKWPNGFFECAIRLALSQGMRLKDIGRTAEDIAINIAVSEEDGNLQRAAGRLGVTDRALQMRRAAARQLYNNQSSPPYLDRTSNAE
ncbi:MAG: sigma-54-dependent transcriptional regulator [bacterium]